jgi:hypothetical protein
MQLPGIPENDFYVSVVLSAADRKCAVNKIMNFYQLCIAESRGKKGANVTSLLFNIWEKCCEILFEID